MARIVKSQTTAVATWEAEMEKQAQIAAGMAASTGGAKFFSTRGGQLSFDGAPIPGNQMGVIIVDWILENVYYEGEFDAGTPAPPTCFAYSRNTADLAPHETVVEAGQAQHETCYGCPQNEFGTASRGAGKACRNTRRLAIIPAGTINLNSNQFAPYTDLEQFQRAEVGYLKIPVTSCKGFDTFVKQIAGAMKRPPHGVFTRVRVELDPRVQFRILFEYLENVPNSIMPLLMARHSEVMEEIEQPYPLTFDRPEPTPPTKPARKAKY